MSPTESLGSAASHCTAGSTRATEATAMLQGFLDATVELSGSLSAFVGNTDENPTAHAAKADSYAEVAQAELQGYATEAEVIELRAKLGGIRSSGMLSERQLRAVAGKIIVARNEAEEAIGLLARISLEFDESAEAAQRAIGT